MRGLDIDFSARGARAPRRGWPIAAAGALALIGVLATLYETNARTEALEASVRTLGRARTAAPAPRLSAAGARAQAQQVKALGAVSARLQRPWIALFEAIEAASDEAVALLALEPEGSRGTVRLSGEAKDAEALVRYVARLSASGILAEVRLSQHEARDARGVRVLRFVLTADWAGERS